MPDLAVLEALLPQIQCGDCGYDTCKPYAKAMLEGKAAINLCLPGGDETIAKLAKALNQKPLPLAGDLRPRTLAIIDEQACIGCTKCMPVCPVDAIIGSGKQLHQVINDYCTGCGKCLPPCPMDCISFEAQTSQALPLPPTLYQERHHHKLARQTNKNNQLLKKEALATDKLAVIAASIARIKQKKHDHDT